MKPTSIEYTENYHTPVWEWIFPGEGRILIVFHPFEHSMHSMFNGVQRNDIFPIDMEDH